MKNKHLLLTLLLALFAPWAAQAQETLTVYEEATETSEYVPFYGYYADESQQDQMIYPASELTAMVGMEIIQMVFYIDDKDGSRDIGEWIVSLGETTATTLIGLDLTTPLTEVYSGKMIFDSDETLMTVTFANGYIYNGGNLLVEFNHPVTESYKHYYFLGVEATGASYCYDEQQNFLPKVTFSYQNPPACPKPMGVTATAPTAHGATVSWTGSSDSYILILGQASTFGSYNFESNSIPAAFTNSTSYPWTVVANTHSGGYCVKSGNAGVNSTTSDLVLEVNLTSAGSVSFSALASSESNWDFGRFLIDGTQQFQTSGTTNSWADYSFDLAAGSHTLTWSFEKDSGTDYGDDCFYVDDIKINLNPTTWDETHTASASPYTFTDLDTETSYLVMVKGVCGSEQSEPSAAVSFTTLVSCPAPQNLTVTTDNVTATATWTGTEGTCNIDINGTVTNDVTSPYTFNVELSTTYNVKVQANCEGETSSWTAPFTFTTHDCLGGHTIEYTLTDSWGDGWTGNAIILKDACDVLETLTIANGYTNSGTLTLCGDYYQLTWQTGEDADETSFTLIVDGAAIYTNQSGENLSDGQVLYTIGTAPTMLPKPTDLTAGTPESRSVELSWTENGEATTWELCVNGDESNPVAANSNPFTLDGLNALTTYTVKVRSTNGTNVSCWSDEITFTTDVACPAPANLTVTNLMLTSATLNWEGEAESYNVRYGVAGGEVTIFEDGFENGLDNWTVISNGEYTQLPWMQFNVDDFGNSQYTNHNGSYVAMSRSYTGSADVSVDNWLITPQVTLDGDLKYWVINDDNFGYAEQYAIYVSTTGNSINDFTLLYTPGNNTTWTEHVVDLRSFNGALGYIAIRHQDYAKDFLLIDDFGIYATQEAGEWTNATSTTNSLDITGLTPETNYAFQVQANCGSEDGMSQWSTVANFTTPDACAAPTGLTAEVTVNAAELSWTGVTDTYNLRYCEVDPTASATIILNVPNDVWGDGSGYQMLIDADATAYDDGDFSDYSIFEYLIPTDATYDPNTTGIVINNSVTIQIPAGTYDWMVTNPSPDWNDVYVAGSNGNVNGAENNFVFEAGKTYEFTLFLVSNSDGDGVNLTITGDANAWTLVEGVTNPYTLENLSAQTMYEYQVQGVDCDGNGGTTDWSASANFTTGEFYTKTIEPYDEHGWYLIASPLAAETNPTDVENLIPANANNYALYRFNQDADLEWENYKAHTFNLEPGKGYLYANNTEGGVDLIFTGAAYDGDSKEVTLHKTAGAEFEGMNLVGNPFAEDAYIDRDYYTMNSTGTEIMTTPSTGAIGAMQGVFVEANSDGETLTFSKQEPTGNKGLVLNLSQGRGVIDRAVIRFGTDRMLHKFVLNENSTKMYIPKAGEDFAVVRSLNSDEVTVSFEPAEDDIYSISINVENLIVRSLILTDKVERVNIDMLHTPSYQFKASTTDPIDRFVLTFKTGPSQFKELFIAGGKSGDFGFFSNGSWMIDNEGEATLQVIDMIGRVLSSETINGSASINVDVAPGVYMLRLINGENVKVQKIVVR